MNGKFLLDTNAVVALLNGNAPLVQTLQSATWVGISVITELEFLSFPGLTSHDAAIENSASHLTQDAGFSKVASLSILTF